MEQFIKDFEKKPIFILSLGVKKSGKSYNTLALLKMAMDKNVFDQYIMCLPVYQYEATDSYDFIKKYKKANPKKMAIFDRYSYLITNTMMKKADGKKRTLIFIDDAALSAQSIYESNFYGMLSIARHIGISLVINYHSLTSGRALSPFIRQNIEYLCLYKIVSEDLLKTIYDEYLSLATDIGSWKEFRQKYIKHVNAEEFRSILLDAWSGATDWNLRDLKKKLPCAH